MLGGGRGGRGAEGFPLGGGPGFGSRVGLGSGLHAFFSQFEGEDSQCLDSLDIYLSKSDNIRNIYPILIIVN